MIIERSWAGRPQPFRAWTLALLLILAGTTGVAAEPCPLGISAETAKDVFAVMKTIPVGGDYRFEGVTTDGSALFVHWSQRGEKCPAIRVAIVNCHVRFRQPALRLERTAAVLARCPGLRAAVSALARAVSGEKPAGVPPYLFPRSAISVKGYCGLVAFVIVIGLSVRYRPLEREISAAISVIIRPLKRIPGGLAGRVIACSLLFGLVAEAGYRTALVFGARTPTVSAPHFDIYGVGESTMVGEPFDPTISVPRLLDYMFGHEIGGRPIIVHNLAERGVPLYPQALRFEHAMMSRDRRTPGLVLVISGHNERIVPGDERGPSWLTVASDHSLMLADAVLALRRWQMIGREQSLAMYEHYLRQIVEGARHAGLLPVLTTMASNLSGIEPNYTGDHEQFRTTIDQGAALEAHGQYHQARELYVRTLTESGCPAAVLWYLAARCDMALGDFVAAREAYWTAVDADPRTMFGRTTRPQNELIRRLAREYDVPLVDAVQLFEERSPHGIPGNDMFMDGQHPTLDGYLLLAHAYARVLQDHFGAPLAQPVAEAEDAARALGLDRSGWSAAMVDAGSWLITTSVGHPLPWDRMALAETRFRSVIGDGDDFSGWTGLALTQATRRGLLQSPTDVAALQSWIGYKRSYTATAAELPVLLSLLDRFGVDDDIIAHVRSLGETVIHTTTKGAG